MELAEFQALVERLDARAAEDPEAYRRTVGLLALAGYGYILTIIVTLLAAVVGLSWLVISLRAAGFALKVVLPFLVVLGAMLKALWVNFPRPEGVAVDPATVPRLAALIEEVRRVSGGPRVDRILLTTDLNAAVVQHPRLGIFGWFENHLILGVPLLQTLPLDEVRAIVAHEFGHLAGRHGRFGAWIYRQRLIYDRFAQEIAAQGNRLGSVLLDPLRRWYFPYFNAYSFALARRQEYEADALAASVAGADTAGRALARIAVVAGWHHEAVWGELDQMARSGAPMPAQIFGRYPTALQSSLTPERVTQLLEAALLVPTDFHDSHPALQARLSALGSGLRPDLKWSEGWEPGLRLLDPKTGEFLTATDELWRRRNGEVWDRRIAETKVARRRLAQLETGAAAGILTDNEKWERVGLTETLTGLASAAQLAREMLAHDPNLHGARFLVARAMLAEGDETGLTELETIVAKDPGAVSPVAEVAFGWLWGRGRRAEAEQWRARGNSGAAALQAADQERRSYPLDMPLLPHGLTDEVVGALRKQVADIEGIRAIYLVRRDLRHHPERPCWVVGVVPDLPWYHRIQPGELGVLTKAVLDLATWPIETRIIPLALELKGLRKRFRAMPGAILYER